VQSTFVLRRLCSLCRREAEIFLSHLVFLSGIEAVWTTGPWPVALAAGARDAGHLGRLRLNILNSWGMMKLPRMETLGEIDAEDDVNDQE
jgi:hypothetical protein